MAFSLHDDKILFLNDFEVSELFTESDTLNSQDFVDHWKSLCYDNSASINDSSFFDDLDMIEHLPSPSKRTSTPIKKNNGSKRKRGVCNVSGRQRALLAWERDISKGLVSDKNNIVFGGEGWPPPFPLLVQEMRQFLYSETGKNDNWVHEDSTMLHKYFNLKYNVTVRHRLTIYKLIMHLVLYFLQIHHVNVSL